MSDALSTLLPTSGGIPQGPILGPSLFDIYFQDGPEYVKSPSAMFADVTLTYETDFWQSRNTCSLRWDCRLLQGWATTWNMIFNVKKSAVMRIGTKHCSALTPSLQPIHLWSDPVVKKDCVQYLGVSLAESLAWSNHVADLIKNIRPSFF